MGGDTSERIQLELRGELLEKMQSYISGMIIAVNEELESDMSKRVIEE